MFGSDVAAMLVDSLVFQYVAFGGIDFWIVLGTFALKTLGGLFWYWVVFVRLQLQNKW